MDVYTVTTFSGKTLNVRGTVYLNGKPIESKEYDNCIYWASNPDEDWVLRTDELRDKRVLRVELKDYTRALQLQELGF